MLKNIKILILYGLAGAGIFYFLVHPFTMVLYWFEFSHTDFSFPLLWSVLKERLAESFTPGMMGMGSAMLVFGGLLGSVFGLSAINIRNKKNLIDQQEHLLKKDLKKLIESGESESVEFKSSIRYDYKRNEPKRNLETVIAKTVAGFLNARGGKLIIGVDDAGNILGLKSDYRTLRQKNKDGHERRIYEIISNFLGPQTRFRVHVSYYNFDDMDICMLDIDPSSEPVYLTQGDKTTFYVRTGNATYPLSVKETVNYLNMKNK